MIELTPLARPYAKAMFESSLELSIVNDIAKELETISMVSEDERVTNVIENPTLSKVEVVTTLTNLLDGIISEQSKKLLSILAENKRLNLLKPIHLIFQGLLEKYKKQKSVKVYVAFDPSDEIKNYIKEKIKSKHGKDANVQFLKDPKIMGGLSLKIGDETFDLSIKGRVNKLINQLTF